MTAGRTYGGETASERAERRRRQLLDAGLEIFGTTGYRTATVRQVCSAAKVADRAFYVEFPSLEDLLVAVYLECTDRLQHAALTALSGLEPDVLAMSRAGLDAFLREVESDPRIARVVWIEVRGVSPRVEEVWLDRLSQFGHLLIGLMPSAAGAQGDGHRVLGDAAAGGISHVVLTWCAEGLRTPRAVIVEVLASYLAAGAGVVAQS